MNYFELAKDLARAQAAPFQPKKQYPYSALYCEAKHCEWRECAIKDEHHQGDELTECEECGKQICAECTSREFNHTCQECEPEAEREARGYRESLEEDYRSAKHNF